MATTMADHAAIMAEIKKSIKEPTSNGRWTDAEYLRRENFIMHSIEADTLCLETLTQASTVAYTQEYTFPATALIISEVRYLGKQLNKTTLQKLAMESRAGTIPSNWTAWYSDTEVKHYYIRANKVGIVPGTITVKANGLDILSRTMSADLSSGSDKPFDGITYMIPYAPLIIYGVCNWCWNEIGEDKDNTMKQYFNELYKQGYQSLRRLVLDRFGFPTYDLEKVELPIQQGQS